MRISTHRLTAPSNLLRGDDDVAEVKYERADEKCIPAPKIWYRIMP